MQGDRTFAVKTCASTQPDIVVGRGAVLKMYPTDTWTKPLVDTNPAMFLVADGGQAHLGSVVPGAGNSAGIVVFGGSAANPIDPGGTNGIIEAINGGLVNLGEPRLNAAAGKFALRTRRGGSIGVGINATSYLEVNNLNGVAIMTGGNAAAVTGWLATAGAATEDDDNAAALATRQNCTFHAA
jgi:hypothetical protein